VKKRRTPKILKSMRPDLNPGTDETAVISSRRLLKAWLASVKTSWKFRIAVRVLSISAISIGRP